MTVGATTQSTTGGHARASWQKYFKLSPDFRTQEGQVKAFEMAASASSPEQMRWLFEFVTGYGKTLTAFGVFWILKQRGLVNRMLVLTPRDEQRTQFADDAKDARQLLGVPIHAWVIEKVAREYKVVRDGECTVFVASYQQLEDGGFFHDLMEFGGTWLVVSDECHHLGEDGIWAKRHDKLPRVTMRLGLSATPIRSDLKKLLGLPERPTIRVTYKEAYIEKVVKRVIGKIDHYYLDVDIDGQVTRLTTESLREEGVTDFSQYETRRQLRYNDNYLNHMLLEPLQDLNHRNSRQHDEHQMVIYCMTCRHANYVCDQINTVSAQLDFPYRAQWIGVGEGLDGKLKTVEENRQILKRFRERTFHILVQVAKAEEGFNIKRASVLVFLHLIGADGRLLQQIGRGLRRNSAVPFYDDTVSVYASSDTPIATIVEQMEAEAREAEPNTSCFPPRQRSLWDIPDLLLINTQYDRTDTVNPNGIDNLTPEERAVCDRHGIPYHEFAAFLSQGRAPQKPKIEPEISPQEKLRGIEPQVNRCLSILVGNIAEIMRRAGYPIEKKTFGQIKNAIHTEWKRRNGWQGHKDMLYDDFKRKYDWLQEINRQLKETGERPSWLRI